MKDLIVVRDLMASGRTKKVDARDANDAPCSWFSERAVSFGIFGAIYRAIPSNEGRDTAWRALCAQVPDGKALAPYTDSLSTPDLLALIDRAAA